MGTIIIVDTIIPMLKQKEDGFLKVEDIEGKNLHG